MEGTVIASRKRTLNQFIRARQQDYPDAIGDFSEVMNAIALGAKMISREINLAGLVDTMGYTGKTNVQGEQVAKLDEWSTDLLLNLLGETGYVCALGSEEVEDPLPASRARNRRGAGAGPKRPSGSRDVDVLPAGNARSIGVTHRESC